MSITQSLIIQISTVETIKHVTTICFMVCCWPQSQVGDMERLHVRIGLHNTGPWPVRKRLSRDHVQQVRSKPGCRIVGLVTTVWIRAVNSNLRLWCGLPQKPTTSTLFSLQCTVLSTGVVSDHIGRREASRGGKCLKTSAYTGQFGCASIAWSFKIVGCRFASWRGGVTV